MYLGGGGGREFVGGSAVSGGVVWSHLVNSSREP